MANQFIQRKCALAFFFFDRSKDGSLQESDLTLFGKTIADGLGLQAGSEGYNKLVKVYTYIWESFFKVADTTGDGRVTLFEYLASCERILSMPNAQAVVANANEAIFNAIDVNGNGTISSSEYAAFLKPNGFTKAEAKTIFQKLDLNGNGTISRDEFVKHGADYWNSTDVNAIGNWMYGNF